MARARRRVEPSDPVVLLTGAAGQLGRAAAARLHREGYRLALVDRDAARCEELARSLGGRAVGIGADLSRPEAAAGAVEECVARLGPVDVLVNNAGVFTTSKVAETTDEEWRRVIGINLDGGFYLARSVLPGMKERGFGRILNVCSMVMKNGGLNAGAAYAASKGALGALTFSLAKEAASFGVTANAIAPAFVDSPMLSGTLSPAALARARRQIPVGRFCTPEEFAHCVAFLISPLSGFITGEILDLNGGMHLD